MSIPGYSAEASISRSTINYHITWAGDGGPDFHVNPAQLPLPNGGGGCKPHFGPCSIPDPTCPSGFSRFVLTADCESDTFCCTKPCPVTCGACTGGSCNPYPNCGPISGSGTQSCTDCHGNKSTRSC
jgi:hypothetical protein